MALPTWLAIDSFLFVNVIFLGLKNSWFKEDDFLGFSGSEFLALVKCTVCNNVFHSVCLKEADISETPDCCKDYPKSVVAQVMFQSSALFCVQNWTFSLVFSSV